MRPIDADALEPDADYDDGDYWAYSIGQVQFAPTIEPDPEIIVCADCKHWICHDRRCGYWNHGVKPLDWCCYAERRTDG